ncbi:MAG: hypothetical protein M3Q65_04325 [Chloroflexota bacterium]|nr:hypothetical protein [Chloroflexota bacterium]
MVREFSKPLEARQVEARARARQRGVRVAVVRPARHYATRSRSEPGVTYDIVRTPAGWACACRGYYETGCCKHIGQVERRASREGWKFGTIAPLAKVARYAPIDAAAADPARQDDRPALDALRERKRRALTDLYGDAAD